MKLRSSIPDIHGYVIVQEFEIPDDDPVAVAIRRATDRWPAVSIDGAET